MDMHMALGLQSVLNTSTRSDPAISYTNINSQSSMYSWGAESSLPVAHPGYQVLLDILFRLGLIANALTQCSS